MEWQPIETAPRDGTPILAWSGYVWAAEWSFGSWGPYKPPCDYHEVCYVVPPTHWMPLPPAPEAA